MTITLSSSESKFGQISCNYISSVLSGSTLSEYVLQKGVTNTKKGTILFPKKDAVVKFRQIRNEVREEHLKKAVKNIEIDSSYRMLNDDIARELQLTKLKENSILAIYLESFEELGGDLIQKMSLTERKIVTDRLMKLYRQNKLNIIEDFNSKMEDVFLSQKTMGTTVGEYVEERVKANTKGILSYMIGFMYEGIQKRLKEPGFTEKLLKVKLDSSGKLDLKVPKTDDEDVLEKLNIELLSIIRNKLKKFNLKDSEILKDQTNFTHAIFYMVKLMKLINGVKNYLKSQKIQFITNNKNVTKILNLAFVFCSDMKVEGPEIPDNIKTLVKGSRGFSQVNPSILWKYYLLFVSIHGDKMTSMKTEEDVKKLVVRISKNYIRSLPRNIPEDQLVNSRYKSKIRTGDVIIYSLDGCGACEAAKRVIMEFHKGLRPAGKMFENKKEDDVPFELRLKLSNSDGSLNFPIILIGGEYIGGFNELDKILKSPNIRPSIVKSGFAPSTELISFDGEDSDESNESSSVTEYTDKYNTLGAAVVSTLVTCLTKQNSLNLVDLANNMYGNERRRSEQYKTKQSDILTKLKKQVFGSVTTEISKAGESVINLESERREEVESCMRTLSNAKISDFYSIEKAGEKYIKDARDILLEHFSKDQLNNMVSNVARGLIREMNLDETLLLKMRQLNLISDEGSINAYQYNLPMFKSGGLTLTPPSEFNELWDGTAKPMICNTLSSMNIYIDDYIDCYTEATFETTCPRLNNVLANIGNDAMKRLEPQIQQYVSAAGRDMAQAQIDRVSDSAYAFTSNLILWLMSVMVYYIIMTIFRKSRSVRISNASNRF